MTVVECPNCGSTTVSRRWVEKVYTKEQKTSFDECANEELKHPPSSFGLMISNTSGMEYHEYLQFTLICNKCGYAKVYDVNGKSSKAR